MNNPKVSIIIATFNAAKTLSVAMDSVMNQIFQDWECIIVDGASKDNTIEIVKSYVNRDSRFRYISEPDKGIYDAFNKGWKMAEGEWIYYLGADDEVLPDAFVELFKSDMNLYEVVYGDIIWRKGKQKKKIRSVEPVRLKGNMPSHQCFIMRKRIIEKMGGFDMDYKICADFELIQKAVYIQAVFHYTPIPIAIFNYGGVSTNSTANLKEAFEIHMKYKTHNQLFLMVRFGYLYLKKWIKILLNI